jgi:hypothetical protein
MANKQFIDVRKRYSTDGSPAAAWDYVYCVDGQEVIVEVHATVTNGWNAPGPMFKQVSKDDVKKAVEDLIEAVTGRGWSPQEPNRLILDEFSVVPIAMKLGWIARRLT